MDYHYLAPVVAGLNGTGQVAWQLIHMVIPKQICSVERHHKLVLGLCNGSFFFIKMLLKLQRKSTVYSLYLVLWCVAIFCISNNATGDVGCCCNTSARRGTLRVMYLTRREGQMRLTYLQRQRTNSNNEVVMRRGRETMV